MDFDRLQRRDAPDNLQSNKAIPEGSRQGLKQTYQAGIRQGEVKNEMAKTYNEGL